MVSSLEIVKLCVSPASISRHKYPVKMESRKRVFRLADSRSCHRVGRGVRVYSSARDGDNQSKGEEPPESLFMKELKRRGMTPTSLLQDYEVDEDENKTGNTSKTTATTPAFDQSLLNQRERSLALNSEGLEEVLGDHIDQKGSIVLPEKLRFDFSHGKPVDPEDLRKIESIVNKQIKDELEVFSKEAQLSEAKRIKGLRAVFGEVYPDPVRVVAIGRRVEDLLADPENDEWSSLSSEFCGGTHITNTREAKVFALLSEEGIAKGIRRVTAVTTECALEALHLASLLEKEVEDASKAEGSALEKKVAALKSRVDPADIPAAKKADIRAKIALLQNEVRKAQKKIAEENLKKSVKIATEAAESAASDGKAFCITQLDVGLDAAAVREAVSKVMQKKGMSIMVFSRDESTNKAVVCAGVPDKSDQFKQLDVTEWLTTALGPLKGRCGKGKGGLATGQGTDASQVNEALELAASFASMKLN